jgi:antitoxin (DNA-binding transcriptional repressor) of toxin-antitoxin stability system
LDLRFPGMWTYFVHMKTATLRDLRNDFAKLEAWLGEGEEIRIERRGQPIAMLTPVKPSAPKKIKMPDFEARRRAIWGDRVFSEEEVKAMREEELGDRG